jgi:hypothetical protein
MRGRRLDVPERIGRQSLWWLVLGLYLAAFVLPPFEDGARAPIGVEAFFRAPLGAFIMLTGGRHISSNLGFALVLLINWPANPLRRIGAWLLARQRWQGAAWAGTLAVALESALAVSHLPSQGGISFLLVGHYVWLCSMTLLAASGWIACGASARTRVS